MGGGPAIPLFDLRIEPEDLESVAAALRDGRLRAGLRVEAFERAFAEHLGVAHVIAVGNCTQALHLAYLAAGVGPGDEVIVPTITFAATAAAAIYCGATPVFADVVGRHDIGIDPLDAEARVTERTRAVCAMHYGGYAAAVDRLRDLCAERGVALIEDAAHAPMADLDARRLGTFGLAGCFSFFSNKVLAVGEGGAVATDDDEVAAAVRAWRDGSFDYRFDEMRAALLHSRFHRLEAEIERRRELTLRYRSLLEGVGGVTVPYRDDEVARSSCYVMPVLLEDPERQETVRAHMRERGGVQTSLLYAAVHEFTAYVERYGKASLPRAEEVARCEITLPLFPLMTEADQDSVVAALEAALRA